MTTHPRIRYRSARGRSAGKAELPKLELTGYCRHAWWPSRPPAETRLRGVVPIPRRVEKPWGHELIWADTDCYVGKILHVRAGHALSVQYHERKDETIHLLRGQMRFFAGPSLEALAEVPLAEGESFRITPGTVHRMQAVTDVDILEASTPHLDDVVRLEDRYGRA